VFALQSLLRMMLQCAKTFRAAVLYKFITFSIYVLVYLPSSLGHRHQTLCAAWIHSCHNSTQTTNRIL